MAAAASAVRSSGVERVAADRADRHLLWAGALFTVAVVLHNLDHTRRGADSVSLDVFWIGTAAIAIEVAVVVLIAQRHRLAPLAASAIGFSLAIGYVVVHFLPERAWLSDSFTSGADVSRLSWAAASLEVVAAITLGVAGTVSVARRGGLASAVAPRDDTRAARAGVAHPIASVMIGGNAVVLTISFWQLFG